MKNLVLVSTSPRRCELLKRLGLSFEVIEVGETEEFVDTTNPEEFVVRIASKKLENIIVEPDKIYSAFDTVVFIDGMILSKPTDRADAKRMLRILSGRWHKVFTGIAMKDDKLTLTDFEQTSVKFYELNDEEIEAYISTGEPMDKSGAYGIQEKGALLVEKVDGCYFNVVGLPLPKFARMLFRFGIQLKELLYGGKT